MGKMIIMPTKVARMGANVNEIQSLWDIELFLKRNGGSSELTGMIRDLIDNGFDIERIGEPLPKEKRDEFNELRNALFEGGGVRFEWANKDHKHFRKFFESFIFRGDYRMTWEETDFGGIAEIQSNEGKKS